MKYLKYWLPVLLWMGFIFWMSTGTFSSQNTSAFLEPALNLLVPDLSRQDVDMIHGAVRKTGHVTEYFILGLLLFRAFRNSLDKQRGWHWAFYSISVIVMYAAGDELHQSFVATRTAALSDVCLDIAGGLLGQGACLLLLRREHRNGMHAASSANTLK